jgi:hypothetical protein
MEGQMANLEEAVVATLFNQSEMIADQVLKHNPFLRVLEDKGNIRKFTGGYEIRKPIMYNQTAEGGFYSHFQSFNLDSIVDWTAFQFQVRQVYEPVAIAGRDKRANSGEEQLLDFVENKIQAAIKRLKNTVSASLKGDGTAYSGTEFEGLKLAVASSPTSGTYGNIDRSVYSFAQNATSTGTTFTASNIQAALTAGIIAISRDQDGPDLGFAHSTAWKHLHSSLTAIQRINGSQNKALGGFKALNYDQVDFVFDGGYGGATVESNSVRLLNTDYWSFDVDRQTYFKPVEAKMTRPVDQDAFFTVILCEGNLCCSAPALQMYLS